jgi:3-oxoacyl-[acyl-carrier protein] reductase
MEGIKPVALVTGASRGIGRAIALQLGRDGYDVAFCYRSSHEAAAEVEAALRGYGCRVLCQPCDVTDFEAVQQLVQQTEKTLGPLALVVNCAGIVRDNPLVLMDPKGWKDVIAANLDGIFNVCRTAVFGLMKRKRGCIINISSVAGVYGNPTQTNYSASKAGIIGFSRALAKEVGAYGIRVNVVAPGFIVTEMTSRLDARVSDRMMSSIPLKRFGDTQEVADLVSFLASERAGYITGQTIHVDGGIVL